jgi:hypothetical protein
VTDMVYDICDEISDETMETNDAAPHVLIDATYTTQTTIHTYIHNINSIHSSPTLAYHEANPTSDYICDDHRSIITL